MDCVTEKHNVVKNHVEGQGALFAEEMGYGSIALKNSDHERFCWAYVLNPGPDYLAYKEIKPNVKDSTARVNTSKLLTKTNIKERIEQIRAELKRRHLVTADDVLQYYGTVMSLSRRRFAEKVNKDGSIELVGFDRLDPVAASIADINTTVNKDGKCVTRYTVPERGVGAAAMTKILGMNVEKRELTGANGGPVEVNSLSELSKDQLMAIAKQGLSEGDHVSGE